MSEVLNISSRISVSEKSLPIQSELSILIRDCIAKSPSAQKRLYDIYAPAAYGVIKRYLYNDEFAAQEVLNDSFYKILTKLDQYTFQGVFEGWIRRIVVNTVTDHLRKNIKESKTNKEVQEDDAFINSDSVEKISHKELLNIIQTIPDAQRVVFNLYVFENYSHKEIATLLNLTESNSRWYLNDARRRLKEKLNFIL